MITIGLTGCIGSGKSTVTEFLESKNYKIIDADRISHEVTEKGSVTLKKLALAFGDDIITADGSLDRKKLAGIVFSDAEKKEILESIVTAEVINVCNRKCEEYKNAGTEKIIFVDAPLLFECGMNKDMDYVWVVTADMDVRVERVMKRDCADREDVIARIRNQMSDEEKIAGADDVIDNSKDLEALYSQVEELIIKYGKKAEV